MALTTGQEQNECEMRMNLKGKLTFRMITFIFGAIFPLLGDRPIWDSQFRYVYESSSALLIFKIIYLNISVRKIFDMKVKQQNCFRDSIF